MTTGEPGLQKMYTFTHHTYSILEHEHMCVVWEYAVSGSLIVSRFFILRKSTVTR